MLLPHLPTPYLRSILQKAKPQHLEGNTIAIVTTDISSPELLKNREEILKEAMQKAFNKHFSLVYMSEDTFEKRRPTPTDAEDLKAVTELLGDDIELEN